VVESAFGYFHPDLVAKIWTSATERVGPRDAARAYNEACHDHGRAILDGVEGLEGFCDAAEAVIGSVHPAGLALYAGWSAEPLPDDVPARAMQLAAVLRELRGGVHLLAVVAAGLTPALAHLVKRPDDYATFGYADPPPDVSDDDRAAHVAAESLTDEIMARHYAVLDEAGCDALAAGVAAMQAAAAR
jgi:Helix-turn-helix family